LAEVIEEVQMMGRFCFTIGNNIHSVLEAVGCEDSPKLVTQKLDAFLGAGEPVSSDRLLLMV
jgi:hypothetical protein